MGDPRVLELRVHGIANAPPHDMLSTTPDDVVKVKGDELGSFWMRESPDPEHHPNVRVEAYSWGNQTRSGGNALAVIGRVFVHLSWLFVLPFGLCNLAYWARRDIPGDKPPQGSETRRGDAGRDRPRWHAGTGAMAIRWFALLQTLFYTTGFMSVMVDLIAVQCYRPRVSPVEGGAAQIELVCAALPEWFDIFEDWSRVSRSALFAVVPVLAMLVIFLVGLRVRGTFEPNRDHDENLEDDELAAQRRRAARNAPKSTATGTPSSSRASNASNASTSPAQGVDPPARAVASGLVDPAARPSEATSPPLLANRGFWRRSRVAQTSERAHFAGVLSFVLLLLTMDTLFEIAPLDVDDLQGWWDRATAEAPFALPGAVIGALLLVATIWVTSLAVNDAGGFSVRATRRLATLVLAISAVCYVLWTLGSIFFIPRDGTGSGDDQFVGLSVAPVVISTVCALIALSSLTWAYRRRMTASIILLALSLLFGGFTALYRLSDDPDEVVLWASFVGTFTFAVVALLLGYFHRRAEKEHRRLVGWHGNGAAVCMLIALFASMAITSLLVIGAHAWLSTSTEDPTTEDRIWRLLPVDPENALDPPDFYVQFAVLLLAILAILLLMGAVVAFTAFTRMPRLDRPAAEVPRGHRPQPNPGRPEPRRNEWPGGLLPGLREESSRQGTCSGLCSAACRYRPSWGADVGRARDPHRGRARDPHCCRAAAPDDGIGTAAAIGDRQGHPGRLAG